MWMLIHVAALDEKDFACITRRAGGTNEFTVPPASKLKMKFAFSGDVPVKGVRLYGVELSTP